MSCCWCITTLPYGETGVRPWGSGWGALNRETPELVPAGGLSSQPLPPLSLNP